MDNMSWHAKLWLRTVIFPCAYIFPAVTVGQVVVPVPGGATGVPPAVLSRAALQKNPSLGRLIFLGKTSDSSQSVWLSLTNFAGSFQLETQGQQVVDAWIEAGAAKHLSQSPFVSTGNGGTHFLMEVSGAKPIQIDSQNQKGGFIFPPDFPFIPGSRPNGYIPLPDIPHRHPNGYIPLPNIPHRHPTGYIPLPDIPQRHPTGYIPLPDIPQRHPTGYIPLPGPFPPRPPRPVPPDPPGPVPPRPPGPPTPVPDLRPDGTHFYVPGRGYYYYVPGTGAYYHLAGRDAAMELSGVHTYHNLWFDGRYTHSKDERKGLQREGDGHTMTLGFDRRLGNTFTLGVMGSLEDYRSTALNGIVETDAEGFSAGPYLTYQLSPRWTLDASFSYGRTENEIRLLQLDAEYTTERYSGSLSATGNFQAGTVNLRPRATVYYTHYESGGYDLEGLIGPFDIKLPRDAERFDYGAGEVTVDINRPISTRHGMILVPYVELGVTYEFERPGDGVILTSDFTTASTSPWRGSVRVGTRVLITKSVVLEASAGYLSIGQRDLDLWEGRVFASWAF